MDEMEHDAEQGQSRQEVEGEGQMGNDHDRKMRGKKEEGLAREKEMGGGGAQKRREGKKDEGKVDKKI